MTKDGNSTGQAGTLESCDCRVIIEINSGDKLNIEVEGPMKEVFGEAIKKVATATLSRLNVVGANVKIMDRGALDYVVEARLEAAIGAADKSSDTNFSIDVDKGGLND